MKLIVDIPEEEYKRLAYIDHFKLRSYIESGKVLPKGHGVLIDRDELIKCFKDMRRRLKPQDYKSHIEFDTRDTMMLNFIQIFGATEPIIERDKEGDAE